MIGYLMVGTNDLEKASIYYDSLLKEFGGIRVFETEKFVTWSFGKGTTSFSITKPFDENTATAGNGVMVALKANNPEMVNAIHAKALALGGSNEGDPGFRGKGFYAGYFRDLDGNKLNIYCFA